MKNLLTIVFLSMMAISSSLIASEKIEILNLNNKRTSMEYGPQIRYLLNNIEHHKWETKIGLGYHIVQTEAPFVGESTADNIYVKVDTYFYGKLMGETLMYMVESKYKGYIDIVDFNTSDRITVRYSKENKNIELLRSYKRMDIYENVKEWSKNPNPIVREKVEGRSRGFVF